MTAPNNPPEVDRLVSAVQSTLAPFETLRLERQVLHLWFATIQTGCALALSIDHLATSVDRLVGASQEETT